jgi:arginyl-tRNA synthetase
VNTHKAFHIGHARTTCLGESIARLLEFQGYRALRLNYQGDIGPHVARCLWGIKNLKMRMPRGIQDRGRWLGLVYSEASKRVSGNEKLEGEVKALTTKLYEAEDRDLMKVWRETRRWSLAYFDTIYRDLGVKFDRLFFESQFGSSAVEEARNLLKKGFLRESDGAVIADLKKFGLDVAVLVSREGYPLYHAKDISLAREEFSFKPDKVMHVVASEQDLYFKQLFKILGSVKREWSEKNFHLSYGLVNLRTGRMASREGTVVTYDELMAKLRSNALEETKKRAKGNIGRIAEMVAVGALKYDLLKMSNNKNITFDWKRALDFHGNSAPYLQYTHARAKSILRKTRSTPLARGAELVLDQEKQLVKRIASFSSVAERAAEDGRPYLLANYLYELATSFNEYYQTTPVIKSDIRRSRLALVKAASVVLKNGLGLLGIDAPERM